MCDTAQKGAYHAVTNSLDLCAQQRCTAMAAEIEALHLYSLGLMAQGSKWCRTADQEHDKHDQSCKP